MVSVSDGRPDLVEDGRSIIACWECGDGAPHMIRIEGPGIYDTRLLLCPTCAQQLAYKLLMATRKLLAPVPECPI